MPSSRSLMSYAASSIEDILSPSKSEETSSPSAISHSSSIESNVSEEHVAIPVIPLSSTTTSSSSASTVRTISPSIDSKEESNHNGVQPRVFHLPPLALQPPPKTEEEPRATSIATASPSSVKQTFSFEEVMSPRHQDGKRYLGGYLQQRISMAGGFLKSWKKKYFRLRDHGLMVYKVREETHPIFEILFTPETQLIIDPSSTTSGGTSSNTTTNNTQTKGKVNGTHVFVLKQVDILLDHETSSKVDVPLYLKTENQQDFEKWTLCLQNKLETRKNGINLIFEQQKLEQKDQEERVVDGNENTDNCFLFSTTKDPPGFENFSTKYLLLNEVGEGSFSIVHKGINRLHGTLYGIKCCKQVSTTKKTSTTSLVEEVSIMKSLTGQHANIISLHGVYEDNCKKMLYVVMDFMKNGDLCDRLLQIQRFEEKEAKQIVHQVLNGLTFLHENLIVHRDIKPENILLHGQLVKIADFGLAKKIPCVQSKLTKICGTMEYAAPEMLCGQPYGLKSDIFSLGIVLYVFLFGSFPFSIESAALLQQEQEQVDTFVVSSTRKKMDVRDMSCLHSNNPIWSQVSPFAQDILFKMLEVDPQKRPSAKDLLVHPWFDGGQVSSSIELLETKRLEECQMEGFRELLSRGLEVIKYPMKKKSTNSPHVSTLTIDWYEKNLKWSPRVLPFNPTNIMTSSSTSKRRVIGWKDIEEIRLGTKLNDQWWTSSNTRSTTSPTDPACCMTIVCASRSLSLEFKTPDQRKMFCQGLASLLELTTTVQYTSFY